MTHAFIAQSVDGKLSLGSEYNSARFRQHLKDNPKMRYAIDPILPESKKMRGYFEGCLVALFCFFQEHLDHHDTDHLRQARDFLKTKFKGEMIIVDGVKQIVPGTTKGSENLRKITTNIFEMLVDDYGCPEVALNPEAYKKWRDTIFPFTDGADNYIDYCLELGLLERP